MRVVGGMEDRWKTLTRGPHVRPLGHVGAAGMIMLGGKLCGAQRPASQHIEGLRFRTIVQCVYEVHTML